jgi:hypothetical protein
MNDLEDKICGILVGFLAMSIILCISSAVIVATIELWKVVF